MFTGLVDLPVAETAPRPDYLVAQVLPALNAEQLLIDSSFLVRRLLTEGIPMRPERITAFSAANVMHWAQLPRHRPLRPPIANSAFPPRRRVRTPWNAEAEHPPKLTIGIEIIDTDEGMRLALYAIVVGDCCGGFVFDAATRPGS